MQGSEKHSITPLKVKNRKIEIGTLAFQVKRNP